MIITTEGKKGEGKSRLAAEIAKWKQTVLLDGKKIIKQFFCKHNFIEYWRSAGDIFPHKEQRYYDDWQIKLCTKCKKEKELCQ